MARSALLLAAIGTLASGLAPAARAGLINGGFEAPNLGSLGASYVEYTPSVGVLPGWTVEAGSVDVQTGYGLVASEGSQYMDMQGNSAGTVSQVMAAISGRAYHLTFDYAGLVDTDLVESSLGDSLIYQVYDGSTNKVLATGSYLIGQANLNHFNTIDVGVTATSSLLGVRFRSDGAGADPYVGPALDRVSLEFTTAAVPEPTSAVLTAIGILLALGRLRRVRRA